MLSCYLSRSAAISHDSHLLELLFACNMARGTPGVYMVTLPLTLLTWLTLWLTLVTVFTSLCLCLASAGHIKHSSRAGPTKRQSKLFSD